MSLERMVLAFAGSVILISIALTHYVDPRFMWLTVFVGANLFQTAFTKFCPLAIILKKMGANSGETFR